VRIAGQLIDASSGAHLWADRFDGVLADIFDLQDTMARSVVGAIGPRSFDSEELGVATFGERRSGQAGQ
jgi:hypothetical protein